MRNEMIWPFRRRKKMQSDPQSPVPRASSDPMNDTQFIEAEAVAAEREAEEAKKAIEEKTKVVRARAEECARKVALKIARRK